MSVKMNTRIDIVRSIPKTDSAGFTQMADDVAASTRAYMETRHGSERWTNLSAFSQATALFRFRRIPRLQVTTEHAIIMEGTRFRILSVEDIRNKGMYVEVLADAVKPSVR